MRGTTRVLDYDSQIEAVHLCLLPSKAALYYSGFRKPFGEDTATRVWRPDTGEIETIPTPADLFCAGHAMLPDGRVLSSGGTLEYRGIPGRFILCLAQTIGPYLPLWLQILISERFGQQVFTGSKVLFAFDWKRQRWEPAGTMRKGRWYPTVCPLPDGGLLLLSGLDHGGGKGRHKDPDWIAKQKALGLASATPRTNREVEVIYGNGTIAHKGAVRGPGIRPMEPVTYGGHAHMFPTSYPRLHVLPLDEASRAKHPAGRVFCSGYGPETKMLDLATWEWEHVDDLRSEHPRHDGNCILLPLDPEDAYRPRVLTFGGSRAGGLQAKALATTEIIDFSCEQPQWRYLEDKNNRPIQIARRVNGAAVLLPDGNIIAVGGNSTGRWHDPVYKVDVYDTKSGTWQADHRPIRVKRGYHCTALLLADGRVLVSGTTPLGKPQLAMEVYSPYYLDEVTPEAPRPKIIEIVGKPSGDGDGPRFHYGQRFRVRCEVAAGEIKRVALLRPGAFTHSFDMNQRHVWARFTEDTKGTLDVDAPPDQHVAPPGHYMVFLIDDRGVPSEGEFVHFSAPNGTETQ